MVKVQEEIACIIYLEFWYSWLKILKYEPYCHFTIIPMISTFYYTSISRRDKKKKIRRRRKEMRRWNRREVVHRKERKEKRDWGERNRKQLLELWCLLHSYRAESVWCTCKVSGESAGEEQKGGGIEVRWPSCTWSAPLPSVKILLETLYFFMTIISEVYIILLIFLTVFIPSRGFNK